MSSIREVLQVVQKEKSLTFADEDPWIVEPLSHVAKLTMLPG
jgi:hypothetical protein